MYPPTQGDQVSTTRALFGHWVGLILLGAPPIQYVLYRGRGSSRQPAHFRCNLHPDPGRSRGCGFVPSESTSDGRLESRRACPYSKYPLLTVKLKLGVNIGLMLLLNGYYIRWNSHVYIKPFIPNEAQHLGSTIFQGELLTRSGG